MEELSDVGKDINDANSDSDEVPVSMCENNNLSTEDCDSPDSKKVSVIKCEKCDKCFSRTYHLKVHVRKKKYSCQECKDTFCSKGALSVHLKANHGTKEFECATCRKDFSVNHSLKRHNENHSVNACVSCNAVFCNAYDLKAHVFSFHTC